MASYDPTELEFRPYPKTPRLFRDMIVTEKIDGTNSAIVIEEFTEVNQIVGGAILACPDPDDKADETGIARSYRIYAQSRNRVITPEQDNFGFASWVFGNASALARALGVGRHFGEWWGEGIQRGYALSERRFSLFNVGRWADGDLTEVKALHVVPTLHEGPFSEAAIRNALTTLELRGSSAAPGYMRPEGVCVYHSAGEQTFKVLVENDSGHKGMMA